MQYNGLGNYTFFTKNGDHLIINQEDFPELLNEILQTKNPFEFDDMLFRQICDIRENVVRLKNNIQEYKIELIVEELDNISKNLVEDALKTLYFGELVAKED